MEKLGRCGIPLAIPVLREWTENSLSKPASLVLLSLWTLGSARDNTASTKGEWSKMCYMNVHTYAYMFNCTLVNTYTQSFHTRIYLSKLIVCILPQVQELTMGQYWEPMLLLLKTWARFSAPVPEGLYCPVPKRLLCAVSILLPLHTKNRQKDIHIWRTVPWKRMFSFWTID